MQLVPLVLFLCCMILLNPDPISCRPGRGGFGGGRGRFGGFGRRGGFGGFRGGGSRRLGFGIGGGVGLLGLGLYGGGAYSCVYYPYNCYSPYDYY